MNVLVTGATGFIGRRVVESLLVSERDNPVTFTSRQPQGSKDLLTRGAHYRRCDLTDLNDTLHVVRGMDVIIHCAGLAGTWGSYDKYYRANVLATRHLLQAAKQNGIRRFINLSSPSIYFDFKDQFNLKETDLPARFSNAYAQTKYEAEVEVQSFHSNSLQTVSLRPRSVIGAGDRNILPRLIRLQKEGRLVQVGHGQNLIDVTTIGNLIDVITICLHAPESAMGHVYNISNGEPILFWDFVGRVLSAAGLPPKRKRVPYGLAMGVARLNEALSRLLQRQSEPTLLPISVGVLSFSLTLDISKAKANLGYAPTFSIQDGLDEFFLRDSL